MHPPSRHPPFTFLPHPLSLPRSHSAGQPCVLLQFLRAQAYAANESEVSVAAKICITGQTLVSASHFPSLPGGTSGHNLADNCAVAPALCHAGELWSNHDKGIMENQVTRCEMTRAEAGREAIEEQVIRYLMRPLVCTQRIMPPRE